MSEDRREQVVDAAIQMIEDVITEIRNTGFSVPSTDADRVIYATEALVGLRKYKRAEELSRR